MMNAAFDQVVAADDATRSGLFTTTAQRLGTTPQNAEKDFWVCWTLDALFNGLSDRPRLLFKGGTSLSKGFGLIERFSEDIDITVFRDDLGEAASVDELMALSGKKRRKVLDAIQSACEVYIAGPCLAELSEIVARAAARTGTDPGRFRVGRDTGDRQSLNLYYPSVTPTDTYVAKLIKIESGAKSALDPNSDRILRPYAADDLPGIDLSVSAVTTVDAERTFWDKIVILHGLRRWFDHRDELKGNGQRVSRHYYDVAMLLESEAGRRALEQRDLGADCVAHAQLFFHRADFDLAAAKPPTFTLRPSGTMLDDLRRDYRAMSGMIFGVAPSFASVMDALGTLEDRLNDPDGGTF